MCGLTSVVGGVMRSPLTGIVVILELTHAWNDLLPIVVASVSADALSGLLLNGPCSPRRSPAAGCCT